MRLFHYQSLPPESLPMWVDIPQHNNTVLPLCIPPRDIHLTSRNNDPVNLLMQPRDIHITWYHTHYIKHITPRDKLNANLLHAATRHTHLTPRDTVHDCVNLLMQPRGIYIIKTHYQYIIYTLIMSRDNLSANLLHRATSHTHYVSRHVLTYGMQIYTCHYANPLHADSHMSTSLPHSRQNSRRVGRGFTQNYSITFLSQHYVHARHCFIP